MDFCTAFKHIKAGKIVKRRGVDITTKKTFWYFLYLDLDYIKLNPVPHDGYFFPIKYKNEFSDLVFDWQPIQADLFALDWEVAKNVRRRKPIIKD
ncbi:hypothetical protein AQUSIP_12700 [Aquicella siphonis]|uniref:Thoeris anti-defense 2-like domain-containing protein n=1 Tax=Aquicella siphonis TaxID=254247 RepID=A0A5E4PG98_9COXI|nr:hypothetical protein [Aquicella siphonis]VVC75969.1 hypothetical protein AQUSIP_12700 [Aquicella siphonis]